MGGEMTLSKEQIEAKKTPNGYFISIFDPDKDALCQQALRAIELESELTALSAKLKEVEGELKKIRSVIPIDFLIAHDTPGATGPTDALDLVGAIRSLVHNARKWEDRARSALSAKLKEQKAAHSKLLRYEAAIYAERFLRQNYCAVSPTRSKRKSDDRLI